MKTSDLTVSGVYAYAAQQLHQSPRPALVLDTTAWMMGSDPGPTYGSQKLTVARAPRQNMRLTTLPYTQPLAVGIPVLVLSHTIHRWLAQDSAERISDSAQNILAQAVDKFGDLLGEYEIAQGGSITAPFRMTMTVGKADGSKSTVDVELLLVRTQNLTGAWAPTLVKEKAVVEQARILQAEKAASQSAADLLDRDIADTLDFLLDDGKERSPFTGLRPDVTRYRGAGELQVSVETFLKLLELAKKGLR